MYLVMFNGIKYPEKESYSEIKWKKHLNSNFNMNIYLHALQLKNTIKLT